jgi:hypothetical protein
MKSTLQEKKLNQEILMILMVKQLEINKHFKLTVQLNA